MFPFIDLGRTLRARGHDVTLLTNEWFAGPVRAADLEYVETGTTEDFERAIANPDLWHPRKLRRQIDFMQQNPDVEICQTEEIWIRNGVRVNPLNYLP